MRADVIRVYKSVHTWTGILSAFALFIAFYAGALTMFEETLSRWSNPPAATAAPPLAQSAALIEQTLAARKDARKEFTLHLGDSAEIPARLTWKTGRADRMPWSSGFTPEGELELVRLQPSGLAQFIDDLHRTAGIPGDHETVELLVGAICLLYSVALVSGLIILLPSLVKDFFALRVGRNLKRMWLDAHNAIGIASLPFHIVIALTAVVFCLHDPVYDVQDKVIYGDNIETAFKSTSIYPLKPDATPTAMLAPQELLARVRAFSPEFEPTSILYRAYGTAGAMARVAGHDKRYMVRLEGFLVMNAATGEILNTAYFPGAQGNWTATVSSFFSLHFGTFGGEPVRWTYFALGLAGAFLFYSGNLLWIETRRKTARNGSGPVLQQRSARWLAAGTVGVCLGSVCGISLTVAAAKLLYGRVLDANAWHYTVYYGVFLACLAWAFWRGAARAGIGLLRLSAATALAVPLASLHTAYATSYAGWTYRPGVDASAAIAALAFAWMARAAARRARQGAPDSVWSLPAARQAADQPRQPQFAPPK